MQRDRDLRDLSDGLPDVGNAGVLFWGSRDRQLLQLQSMHVPERMHGLSMPDAADHVPQWYLRHRRDMRQLPAGLHHPRRPGVLR